MNKFTYILILLVSFLFLQCGNNGNNPSVNFKHDSSSNSFSSNIDRNSLPFEAYETLQKIENGGPFFNEKDGAVFGNYEKMLPVKPRGYYREYTVKTPGVKGRGAKRIIAGKGGERFYTDDHYKTFKEIK